MNEQQVNPMPRARISLVMPNYNHGKFIGQALGALFTQARPADEIIIIDDASTDESIGIIERLAHARAEVSIVRHRNRAGVLKTLNEGLEIASGDLIAFPAADDLLEPDFLKESEGLMQRFPAAPFCAACVEIVGSEGKFLGTRPIIRPIRAANYVSAGSARSMLMRGDNFFLGPVTLYRRQRLIELGGFDESLGASSDGIVQRRMAVRWGFCFVPKVLGAWRIHGVNYSVAAVDSPEKLDRLVAATSRVIASESPWLFPQEYSGLFERRLRFNAARLGLLHRGKLGLSDKELRPIYRMVRASKIDKIMLRAFRLLGPASTLLSMAWIGVRLHPFSWRWLGTEAAYRLISGRVKRKRP